MGKQESSSQVRVEFEGVLLKRYEALKGYFGLENGTELVRLLVNDKYKQLFPKEVSA